MWIITEDFRGLGGNTFSYRVRKYLGWLIALAVRSMAYVCGRSIAEIAGSNPVKGMDVSPFCLLCVV